MSKSSIIWVNSYPKSGNTWVRLFLMHYFYSPADRKLTMNDVSDFITADTDPRIYEGFAKRSGKTLVSIKNNRKLQLQAIYSSLPSNQTVFMKSHACNHLVNDSPYFNNSLTKAFIYLVRDPRDIVISFSNHLLGTKNFRDIQPESDTGEATIEHYRLACDMMINERQLLEGGNRAPVFLNSWENHVKSFLSDKRTILIRYEDLISDSEKVFRALIRKLTGDVKETKLMAALNATKFGALMKEEKHAEFNESISSNTKFFRSGKVKQWKDRLPEDIHIRIERHFSEQMKRLGYVD